MKHIRDCLPKEIQVFFRESGLVGEMRRDKPVGDIDSVRDGVFPTHGPIVSALFLSFGLCRHGHTGDGVLQCDDRIDRSSKGQLDGTTDLSCILPGAHNGSECPDIKETAAHIVPGRLRLLTLLFFLHGFLLVSIIDKFVQNRLLFDKYVVSLPLPLGHLDKIAHFSL